MAGSDQVVVTNDIDWHETHVLLKAAFALSATSPFATTRFPTGRFSARRHAQQQLGEGAV